MADMLAALLFALITASGALGVTSLGFFLFHRNPDDRDMQQQTRIEYAFFGIFAMVVMALTLYLFYSI